MIQFRCAACQQPFTVRPEFAGRPGTCTRCGRPFVVPGAPATASSPGHARGGAPARSQPPSTSPAPPPVFAVPPAATPAATRRPGPPAPSAAPVRPRRAAAGHLEVVHGPEPIRGQCFPLAAGRALVLGRDPAADLTIPSERVSRRHCRFEVTGEGGVVLEDLGSQNGTLVNQVRIEGRKVLVGGEYVQAGDCLFHFVR